MTKSPGQALLDVDVTGKTVSINNNLAKSEQVDSKGLKGRKLVDRYFFIFLGSSNRVIHVYLGERDG